MPVKNRVNVQLMVNDTPLHEYQTPEDEAIGATTEQSYVEIKAGQHFAVRITLMTGFKLHYASIYYWRITLDDYHISYYRTIDCENLRHKRGMILHDQVCWIDRTYECDQNTKIWSETPFVFGALGTSKLD